MTLFRLLWEYLLVGAFSFGGGMAAVPFLQDMADRTGWFSQQQLADMIAVSESTPGPIGVNMATYVGMTVAGPLGALLATLGFMLPGFLFVLVVSAIVKRFQATKGLERVFYGLRPVSAALIAAALAAVARITLVNAGASSLLGLVNWPALLIAGLVFVFTNFVKPTKKLHPIVFLAASAVLGVVMGSK